MKKVPSQQIKSQYFLVSLISEWWEATSIEKTDGENLKKKSMYRKYLLS